MTMHDTATALIIAASLTIGCTAPARSPEPLPLDRVECARCRMLISTEAGGGEIVSASEDTRFYDDLGCLAADWASHQSDASAYVRTGMGTWRVAQDASYAQPAIARTAMGFGIAAFATAAEAQTADRVGRALTFDEVLHLTGAHR